MCFRFRLSHYLGVVSATWFSGNSGSGAQEADHLEVNDENVDANLPSTSSTDVVSISHVILLAKALGTFLHRPKYYAHAVLLFQCLNSEIVLSLIFLSSFPAVYACLGLPIPKRIAEDYFSCYLDSAKSCLVVPVFLLIASTCCCANVSTVEGFAALVGYDMTCGL